MIPYLLYFFFNKFINLLDTITLHKLPLNACVCVICFNKDGKLLLQKRADNKGYSLPGGLSKNGEKIEDCAIRETFEETGIKIKNLKFLFYVNPTKKYSRNILFLFEGTPENYDLKDSWEGSAMWLNYSDVKGKMAFNLDEIMKRYYSDLNS